jgi:NTP pyrophosphatase (non-canonical NTP hydrolase)
MNQIKKITDAILKFRDERDWEQFHNAKDLAVALNVEAGELLELYLWKNSGEADPDKVREELADVLNYSFLIAEKYGLDIEEIMLEKINSNAKKYPSDKVKGSAKKYSEL